MSRYTASPFLHAAVWALAVSGFAFVIHASYPGYLNSDSIIQLTHIFNGWRDDWHAPFISLVWSGLLQLFPGPVGFIVFDNLLIWGALAVMAAGTVRVVGPWGLMVLLLPAMPGLFNYLGHVHKDAMLVAWLLAAFACAFLGNRDVAGPHVRLVWLVCANLLTVAAFLVRPNVIFALIPLLLYANHRLGWRKGGVVAVVLLVLMPMTQSVQNRLLGVVSQHPADSIKTYHLLALSYFEGRNLFPGQWTADESRAIVETCYSPVQWDAAAPWGQCSALYHSLQRQGVWGSGKMTRAWLDALAANPLGAYSAMAATFQLSMHDPNSRAMLFEQPRAEAIQFDFASPLRASTELARAYIESELNDRFGRPWVFAVVFAASAGLVFALRLGGTPFGMFALAFIASGTIYLLTYFPFNVSAEYRYFYWCGFAAYLGLVFTLLAWIARRRAGHSGTAAAAPQSLPASVRLVLCALLALMIALVFGSARLPLEARTVMIVPQGDGAITVARLGAASTPRWMVRHEGQIEAPGWHWHEGLVLRSENGAGPLVARLDILHHAIRLHFVTGPDGGSVRVDDGGFSRIIDTRAPAAGEIVVDLPPYGRLAERPRHGSWHAPARVLSWTVLLTALLFYLGGGACRRRA